MGNAKIMIERAERERLCSPAMLNDNLQTSIEIELVNISLTGCLVVSPVAIAEGALVTLDLPGLGFRPGVVSRTTELHVACEYLVPLDQLDLIKVRQATVTDSRFRQLRSDVRKSARSRIPARPRHRESGSSLLLAIRSFLKGTKKGLPGRTARSLGEDA